jgi:AP-2 complex subunit beta-1
VQEATVVIRNIFRKYPNQYESIISVLCENLDSLDEPEAKAAMIWVIGQYADRINDSDVLLDEFLDTFRDEPHEVQLALLTATVKLFLQRPTKGEALIPKVLKWATQETDNPDLRDRGYMYWRLLSSEEAKSQQMAKAKHIVMGNKPAITAEESEKLDPATLEEMCLNIGTLATVYLKPVNQVFRSARPRRLTDSPALQRHTLPTAIAAANAAKTRPDISLDTSTTSPSIIDGNRAAATTNGTTNAGDLSAAADAADVYFSGVSSTQAQMAKMALGNGDAMSGFGGSPVSGNVPMQSMYVVNQNAPQGVVGGADTGGDLLLL